MTFEELYERARAVVNRESLLVSACLLGEAVRYDGADKRCDHEVLRRWVAEGRVVSVCPEVAGGLPIQRAHLRITRVIPWPLRASRLNSSMSRPIPTSRLSSYPRSHSAL